jgi:MoxR-like ATPase
MWLAGRTRKPLVLRGARQVGKKWLVRDLASRSGRHLVEVNFEREHATTLGPARSANRFV